MSDEEGGRKSVRLPHTRDSLCEHVRQSLDRPSGYGVVTQSRGEVEGKLQREPHMEHRLKRANLGVILVRRSVSAPEWRVCLRAIPERYPSKIVDPTRHARIVPVNQHQPIRTLNRIVGGRI